MAAYRDPHDHPTSPPGATSGAAGWAEHLKPLGLASAKTTLDVYGHLFPDGQDRTRAVVDAALMAADLAPRQEASE
jgi:hypothetical protein